MQWLISGTVVPSDKEPAPAVKNVLRQKYFHLPPMIARLIFLQLPA